jgi:hypothetical protein
VKEFLGQSSGFGAQLKRLADDQGNRERCRGKAAQCGVFSLPHQLECFGLRWGLPSYVPTGNLDSRSADDVFQFDAPIQRRFGDELPARYPQSASGTPLRIIEVMDGRITRYQFHARPASPCESVR